MSGMSNRTPGLGIPIHRCHEDRCGQPQIGAPPRRDAGRSVTDDRVVLPLERTRTAAALLHDLACLPGHPHEPQCLVPLLDQRDQLLTGAPSPGAISGDCLVPALAEPDGAQ